MTNALSFLPFIAYSLIHCHAYERKDMTPLNEEERQKILNSSPVGTWALMLIVGAGMAVAWLMMYYGVFLPRGHIG